MTAPRMRHVNRVRTLDNQILTMQHRASTGEVVVWNQQRPVPIAVTKP